MEPPKLDISPPLLNSANPWATTLEDLQALYNCPHTGAVTTRTSLIEGFPHDDARHQYAFFSPGTSQPHPPTEPRQPGLSSLNNLGYSPIPLSGYLGFIKSIHDSLPPTAVPDNDHDDGNDGNDGNEAPSKPPAKPIILSVTGSPESVAQCSQQIQSFQPTVPRIPLAVEINLSCPNIPDKSPPAYDKDALGTYLALLPDRPSIPHGLKTPPYTHGEQFAALVGALADDARARGGPRISFLTATNTLGSCLVLDGEGNPVLPSDGLGGMAGPALHPLALGNVRTLREATARDSVRELLGGIQIIGVGGVSDAEGFRRMRTAGAYAVGVGTALGVSRVEVFEKIAGGFSLA